MDSDKKTHGFCKAELRKRFRLVFYLGKLSLAAYSEQFGKPGRNPTGPAHASRLVFTDHNRPPTAAMRQRHNEEGLCAADRCSQPRGSRRPWQKAAHPARHPSLAGCSKRIASLTPQGNIAFETRAERPPKSRILHTIDHSAKQSLFKGRHHLDSFAHVISILYLVNAITRLR